MTTNENQSPAPTKAHLRAIEIADAGNFNNKLFFHVVVSVDDHMVITSQRTKRTGLALRWEWNEQQFDVHPSSSIKIEFYRRSRVFRCKHRVVGSYTTRFSELIHTSNNSFEFRDENRRIYEAKIDLSLVVLQRDQFKTFMASIDKNIEKLKKSTITSPVPAVIGQILQITKSVMDRFSEAHPIVKVSWTILSAAYDVVKDADIQDEVVMTLAEALRETLGLADEHPNLIVIEGTTNVIEDISRLSLNVSSLIYEYAKPNLMVRAVNLQISPDLRDRIQSCQNSCIELRNKFRDRVLLEIRKDVQIIKDSKQADKIKKWLDAPDTSRTYKDALGKRKAGTCNWFLDGKSFSKFKKTPGSLWVNGNSGCGKTVLAAAIMEQILKFCNEMVKTQPTQKVAYARFLFDGRDSQAGLQHHDKFLSSLISQLSGEAYWDNGIPSTLVEFYDHGRGALSVQSLETVLRQLIAAFHSVYIIVDSLDECVERKSLLGWIKRVTSIERIANLHMLVVSRPEVDIQNVLQPLMPCVNLTEVTEVNQDISAYINYAISPLEDKWGEELAGHIKQTLISRADGTFRWVSLQILALERCSNEHEIENQLKTLPKDLNETYDRILQNVEENARDDVKMFLHFLCFAARPMKLAELAEVATIDFHPNEPDASPRHTASRRYIQPRDALHRCSGFVVESSDGQVKLAHFSVKEYLLSNHLKMPKNTEKCDISHFHIASEELAHAVIGQTCLAYLLQFNTSESLTEAVLKSSHLARYAAEYWTEHAKSGGIDNSDSSSTLVKLSENLVTEQAAFTNCARIWDIDYYWMDPDLTLTPTYSALYYTAWAGLKTLAQYLLDTRKVDVNAIGGEYGSALQAAVYKGHLEIVRLLCEHGADINVTGGEYRSALRVAAYSGSLDVVRLLCAHGTDINATGGQYGIALQTATYRRHLEMVRQHGTDINATRGQYRSALQTATYMGWLEIVKLLCEHGADINATGGQYGSALLAAIYNGRLEIVKLLCEHGADINATGGQWGSALQTAAFGGDVEMVRLLCEHGADINAAGGEFGSALQAAAYSGHLEIIRLLCDHGADINATGGKYGSALQTATYRGHLEMVKLLCEHGADINETGGKYGSALFAAAYRGWLEIVRLLCEHGADPNATGGERESALQAAAFRGDVEMVRLLCEYGADINATGGQYGSALQAAAYRGWLEIVKLLCEHGANINVTGGLYGGALLAAADGEEFGVVEYLLDHGADVNVTGPFGTALEIALRYGNKRIADLLQQHMAEAGIKSSAPDPHPSITPVVDVD